MTLESGGGGVINSDREGSTPLNLPILRALVRIAAIMFFGILVYHCYSQVKNTKAWKKLSTWVSVRARFEHTRTMPDSDESENEEKDERDQLLPQALPPVIRFDHLREPLVEV